jgi:hypothetical protein
MKRSIALVLSISFLFSFISVDIKAESSIETIYPVKQTF